jgi:hypothetical protein
MERFLFTFIAAWTISLPFVAQTASAQSSLQSAMAARASQRTDVQLVEDANRSNWNRLPYERSATITELRARAQVSTQQAGVLTTLFLRSFLQHQDILGTHVHSVFLDVLRLAVAGRDVDQAFLFEATRALSDLQFFLKDAEDRQALESARSIFYGTYIAGRIQNPAGHAFGNMFPIYSLFGTINGNYRMEWISSQTEFPSLQNKVFDLILSTATINNYSSLAEIYSSRRRDLPVRRLLERMHQFNAHTTLQLVQTRIENFNEEREQISSVVEEISFLRAHGSSQLVAALMPKILRLLELAERRNDQASRALLFSSLSGSSGGSGTSGGGSTGSGGSGGTLTWGQISGYSGSNNICTTPARNAEELYRRNLLSSSEMVLALRDLSRVQCDNRGNRSLLLGTIATICENAKSRNDQALMNSCLQDVFNPLTQWLMQQREGSARDLVASALSRIYNSLADAQRASLPVSCRIRVVEDLYDYVETQGNYYLRNDDQIPPSRSQVAVPRRNRTEVLAERNSSGQLEVKRCQEVASSESLTLSERSSGGSHNGLIDWNSFSRGTYGVDSCIQSILMDPRLRELMPTFREIPGETGTRYIYFETFLRTRTEQPAGGDSCRYFHQGR